MGAPTKLELEVRFDREPIEGQLCEAGATKSAARPFSGWLGLMAALEAAGHTALAVPDRAHSLADTPPSPGRRAT